MSGASGIRLLLCDVDGTLVTTDKIITQEALDAAAALGAAGISLAVASSRPPRGMAMLVEPLGLTLPMVCCNGAAIVHPDLSIIAVQPISVAATATAIGFLANEGMDVWVYTETEWLVRDPKGPHVEREAWILGFDPVTVRSFDAVGQERILKIVGVSDDHAHLAGSEQKAQGVFGDSASATRSSAYFLDVTSREANKGAALLTLAQRLNLAPAEIAAMGDMPNDVLMFRHSGFSIAMGNASAAVKAEASVVTTTNDDNGFARAIDRYFLQLEDV